MGIISNYIDYRKHKPEYKDWKNDRNIKEQAKLDYIKNSKIDEHQKQQDIKRAQAVLNAVDIMDEYSQTRAEDMEVAVQAVASTLSTPISYISYGVGALISMVKPLNNFVAKNIEKFAKTDAKSASFWAHFGITGATALIVALAYSPIMSAWGCKKELQASRMGRLEAMENELASVKQFAILDENQQQKLDEIAKDIKIEEKEAKHKGNVAKGSSLKKTLKLLRDGDPEYQVYLEKIEKINKENQEKFDTAKLSEQEILEAKKDKQLIQHIVEKIDIASQDYAENVELATSTINTLALGSGGLLGLGMHKILTSLNVKRAGVISLIAGFLTMITGSVYAAKIQKQSSRLARHKVKEELMKNPEQLIYVDDEKIQPDKNAAIKSGGSKENFFKFLFGVLKDNKEYNEYQKIHGLENKKKTKAKEQIELTKEQEKRAHQLQQNVFKMFNKLDEKSQTYSESSEAIGETAQTYIALAPAIFMSIKTGKLGQEIAESGKANPKTIGAIFLAFIPSLLANILITKDQKNASRVANMLAIKEMDDYKHFADYSNKTKQEDTSNKNTNIPVSPFLSMFKKQA